MKEVAFNTKFAQTIKRVTGWPDDWIFGDETKPELFEGSTKSPDVLLALPQHPPVIVECKFDESSADPVNDARNKLGLLLSDKAGWSAGSVVKSTVAVFYPPGANQWKEKEVISRFIEGNEKLRWKFITGKYSPDAILWPKQGWLQGTVSDFSESITKTAASSDTIIKASQKAAAAISSAATLMLKSLDKHPDEVERICQLMGAPGFPETGMRIAGVVWFDALLMLNELNRVGVSDKNTSSCRDTNGDVSPKSIHQTWNSILDTNYQSVFQPATETFPKVSSPATFKQSYTVLVNAVESIEQMLLGKVASVGGEIFARVIESDQRKKSAAFYTRPEAAEFLAFATLSSRANLPTDYRDWRIADFACGTGILLRAGYRRLRQFAAAEQAPLNIFHARMMEEGLCGLDIAPIAVHLTATGLVGLQPEVSYDDTNIGVLPVGLKRKQVFTGSVELLNRDSKVPNPQLFTSHYDATRGQDNNKISVLKAEDESFDAILMNPPYSRSRGGQAAFDLSGITEQERELVQNRVKYLKQNTCGDMKAGLSSIFTAIADRKLKPNGRIGIVLPSTAAAQGSYKKMRKMFEENYSDIIAVYCDNEPMSADTGMGEMILLARKGKSGRQGIGYVSLDKPFFSASAATEIARNVNDVMAQAPLGNSGVLNVGGDRVGSWYVAPLTGLTWGGVGMEGLLGLYFSAVNLAHGIISINGLQQDLTRFPTTTIGDLFNVGPSHDLIGHPVGGDPRGAFEFHERDYQNPQRESNHLSLWKTDNTSQVNILVDPTHYGIKYGNNTEINARISEKSKLFYQRNMRWTSQKILVAATLQPTLGSSAWAPLRGGNELTNFAFSVWANSIFGFVNHWLQAGRQQLGRSRTQIEDIQNLRCPDFNETGILDRTESVLSSRDTLFGGAFNRANLAHQDPHRRELNRITAHILGIPKEHQDSISQWFADKWVLEPSVR